MFRKLKMKRKKKQHDSLLESRLETISELTKGLGKPEFKLLMEAVEAVYEARTKLLKVKTDDEKEVKDINEIEKSLTV